jgi:hypothetical protein
MFRSSKVLSNRSRDARKRSFSAEGTSGMAQRATGPSCITFLGSLHQIPDFAITDEDILEFVHSLQSETRHPPNLYRELEEHSLRPSIPNGAAPSISSDGRHPANHR